MKKRKNNFMKYSYSKNINTTFEQAEIFVRDALLEIGFGILTEISIHDAFKEKLNIDYKKYKILGACNPQLAHEALESESKIGILMPCNVIIADNEDGTIQIVFPKAESLLDITKNTDISTLSKKADELLESAFNKITS